MRTALLAAVLAALTVLSGCAGVAVQGAPTPETDGGGTVSTAGTPDLPDGEVTVVDGTLVVNRTVTDENLTYLPERDAVRYVEMWRHSNHDAVENGSRPEREPVYGTMPFEDWGAIECSSVTADGVWAVIEARTDSPLDGVTVGSGVSDDRRRVTVTRQTTVDRDGSVVGTPTISRDRLDAVVPDEAAVTVSLANRSYSCRLPIRTRNTTLYLD